MQIVDPCVPLQLVPPGSRAQIIGKDQQEYLDLPAIRTPLGHVITRWTLTDEERARVLAGEDSPSACAIGLEERIPHERIEVRCCCQPQKLLGWLPLSHDVGTVHAGLIVHFIVSPAHGVWPWPDAAPSFNTHDVIDLPVAEFITYRDGERITRLALKSEETPIARLRLIPGFVENSRP